MMLHTRKLNVGAAFRAPEHLVMLLNWLSYQILKPRYELKMAKYQDGKADLDPARPRPLQRTQVCAISLLLL